MTRIKCTIKDGELKRKKKEEEKLDASLQLQHLLTFTNISIQFLSVFSPSGNSGFSHDHPGSYETQKEEGGKRKRVTTLLSKFDDHPPLSTLLASLLLGLISKTTLFSLQSLSLSLSLSCFYSLSSFTFYFCTTTTNPITLRQQFHPLNHP